MKAERPIYYLKPGMELVLASASPRRAELLGSLGLPFRVEVSGHAEDMQPGESAAVMVERLAFEKAAIVSKLNPSSWVIGADTTVLCEGKILGKPVDAEEAALMLRAISGRQHEVWGAFALVHATSGVKFVHCNRSLVEIASLSDEEIEIYIAGGEPLDKAGSYAVQGVGAAFVRGVEGSYTNVVGLNLSALREAMLRFDVMGCRGLN